MALASSVLWLIAACAGGGEEPPRYRNVLFISMDTTRADHLGLYGNAEVKTPAIDALGAEGVVFDACMSAAATTLASHTSLLTGTYPLRHGVTRNGFQVSPENELLQEVLRDAGFYCAAVLGSAALTHKSGLDQGFDHYDDDFDLAAEAGGRDQDQRSAADVTERLLSHVDEVLQRRKSDQSVPDRMFLVAHYFDPHAPYAPGAEMAQRYGVEPMVGDFDDIEQAVQSQQARILRGPAAEGLTAAQANMPLGQQSVIQKGLNEPLVRRAAGVPTKMGRTLARLYAGEVTRTDDAIGTLLAGLAARGVLKDTLVVLTADHGETFWEHGNFWNHGLWVSQTDVHVPLILRFPDGRGAGRRVDTSVSGVDVMPTILEALGLVEARAGDVEPAHGRSLMPAIEGLALGDRATFSEATQPGPILEVAPDGATLPWGNARKPQAVRLGDWKLIDAGYLGLQQLFHLGRDPGERTDLLAPGASPLSEEARGALADLQLALSRWRASASPKTSAFDPSQIDTLRGLGYTEGQRK
ncbi:Arylsulfatase [Planctomycetes bacterium Poly30]|uniref:Arylsulfatase n=1 Tax=Saltatorellus ferox TaxID=2528018 RepID=A0A518ESW2_9BACT|nr:Arylsulfatase [Planctomycetes bacterium Poly30]